VSDAGEPAPTLRAAGGVTVTLPGVPAAPDPGAGRAAPGGTGPWRLAARRLARDPSAFAALVLLLVLGVVSVLSPWLVPYDPAAQPDIVALKSQPPSLLHPFGTDPMSRDVLSRVLDGSRVSLAVALASVLLSACLGTLYGSVAGMAGPRVDALLMRAVDAIASVPRVLVLIAVLSLWGAIPVSALVVIIGATGWFATSRLVRAEVRAVRGREFVVAARALGASRVRLLVRHVLPNVLSPVVVSATLGVGNVIALEAALAYLGIGVQPPRASWGNIIQDGADQIAQLWWISLFPGLAIATTVMAVTRLGDGLRDALSVRGGRDDLGEER
jgi:peptide/nickel transport system permease protein